MIRPCWINPSTMSIRLKVLVLMLVDVLLLILAVNQLSPKGLGWFSLGLFLLNGVLIQRFRKAEQSTEAAATRAARKLLGLCVWVGIAFTGQSLWMLWLILTSGFDWDKAALLAVALGMVAASYSGARQAREIVTGKRG